MGVTRKSPQRQGEAEGAGGAAKRAPKRRPLPRARYTRAELAAVFERFQQADPEPVGELEHSSAFTLLVAVVLSAQSTDRGVNRATSELFAQAATPEAVVALGEERVREHVRTLGLYRNKAANVVALSERLIADHGGAVPSERDALVRLPGVGRKTANVVLNMWWGRETFPVDTHVFRLGNRIGIAPGRDVDEVERVLDARVPAPYRVHAHHWLILHGRYTCTARSPKCGACVIRDLCKWKENPFRPRGKQARA